MRVENEDNNLANKSKSDTLLNKTAEFDFAPVEEYTENIGQNIIKITEDKIRLCLNNYINIIDGKKDWLFPFGFFITLIITLTTAEFKDIFSIPSSIWRSIYLMLAAIAGVATLYLYFLKQSYKTVTVEEIVIALKGGREKRKEKGEESLKNIILSIITIVIIIVCIALFYHSPKILQPFHNINNDKSSSSSVTSNLSSNNIDPSKAFVEAARNGLIDEVKSQLSVNPNIINTKYNDMAALHWAANQGDSKLAEILLSAERVDIDIEDGKDHFTPLHHLSNQRDKRNKEGRKRIINLLLPEPEKGKRANIEALSIAIDKNTGKILSGQTPLHLAILEGKEDPDTDIIKLLIIKGANVNSKGLYDNRPLHYAASNRKGDSIEIIKELLNHNADINAENLFKQTPLDVAARQDVEIFLKSQGAKNGSFCSSPNP